MNRRLLAVAVVVCLSASSAFARGFTKSQDFRPATPEELAIKSVEGHDGADAVILDWIRVDDDEFATSADYYRIKILTEDGKKHADVELTYVPGYPFYGNVTDISARTIRPDGTIVPFDGKVYNKVLLKVRRTSVRAKTFTFADVQPGSIIEYRYIRRWADQYRFDTHWSVQRDIPIRHASLRLKPHNPDGQFGSFFTYVGLPAGTMPLRVKDQYELDLDNMPALRSEAFMPPEEQMRARVNFFYTDSAIPLEKFWPEQSKIFAETIEKFIGKGGRNDAARLSQGETDRTALLKKIYAHVQSIRNLSYEEEKTDQEIKKERIKDARNAEDVLKKGSGYSTEINRAFVAIARQAGFDADAVRVAPRDEFFFSDKVPNVQQMSGEIVVVNLDGKQIFLDPGTRQAPFGVVSWEKTAVPGFQVVKGKANWLQNVAITKPTDAVVRRKADLRIEGENLEGTITVTFTGQEALVRRLATVTDDDAARKKAIEDEVKAWFPDGATLKLTALTGHDTFDPDVTASFDVTLPNLVSSAGSKTIVPISVFAANAKNPFGPATRKHPIYFPYPNSEDDEVKLALPEGLQVANVPSISNLDGGALSYRAETRHDATLVTYKRNSSVNVTMIDPKFYGALRNFYSQMTNADQQPLVLVPVGSK